jgi:Protein of unknown function (DUF2849)
MPSVVTANNLRSGTVVYLGTGGGWVPALRAAAIAHDASELKRLEAQAQAALEATLVTAVYAFDVRVVDGEPVPLSVRERIRASGAPTI